MNVGRSEKFARRDAKEKFTDAYTGGMNEQDALGEFKGIPGFLEAHRAIAEPSGYLPFERALGFVKEYGRQDPTNPTKPFAKELRLAVIEELGLEDLKEMDRVKFYTAVGTSADVFHGVDGWIEYTFPTGQQVIVTLDVTKNTDKVSSKAEVLIHQITDPEEDEETFLEQVAQHGTHIARVIREQEEPTFKRAA